MDRETFKITPRLEAPDLLRDWRPAGPRRLPLRIGTRHAGLLQVTNFGSNQLQLTWSVDVGRGQQDQTIKVIRFGSQECCLVCPDCGRWRKQLFMVPTGKTPGPKRYWFTCRWCRWCADLEPVSKRSGRRGSSHPHERKVSETHDIGTAHSASRGNSRPGEANRVGETGVSKFRNTTS
jgi:hypothetical protein